MTEQPTSSESHDPAAEPHAPAAGVTCPSVDELLKRVIHDINAFDARKLPELKTNLEQFIKVKDAAIAEYQKKYDDFLKRWNQERTQLDQLRNDLQCSYPDGAWKKLIQDGVCPVQAELNKCKEDLKSLKACGGINEKQQDEAKEALGAANTTVEAWKTATQKIEQALNYNQDLIKQIQNLSQGQDQDRKFRVCLLWFKGFPSHDKLRPKDQPISYPEETPEKLCAKGNATGSTQGSTSSSQQGDSVREAPWIVKPEDYRGILDRAFCDYKTAKDNYAQAVAAFQAGPDDLASVTQQCADKTKSFDDNVKKKLRDATSAAMADGSKCS